MTGLSTRYQGGHLADVDLERVDDHDLQPQALGKVVRIAAVHSQCARLGGPIAVGVFKRVLNDPALKIQRFTSKKKSML